MSQSLPELHLLNLALLNSLVHQRVQQTNLHNTSWLTFELVDIVWRKGAYTEKTWNCQSRVNTETANNLATVSPLFEDTSNMQPLISISCPFVRSNFVGKSMFSVFLWVPCTATFLSLLLRFFSIIFKETWRSYEDRLLKTYPALRFFEHFCKYVKEVETVSPIVYVEVISMDSSYRCKSKLY